MNTWFNVCTSVGVLTKKYNKRAYNMLQSRFTINILKCKIMFPYTVYHIYSILMAQTGL